MCGELGAEVVVEGASMSGRGVLVSSGGAAGPAIGPSEESLCVCVVGCVGCADARVDVVEEGIVE